MAIYATVRTLDEVWAEAEAALPEGWAITVTVYPPKTRRVHAEAWNTNGGVSAGNVEADGTTLTFALHALASRLRARK